MNDPVTILIVDDNPLFRETLREILRLSHPHWQILEACDGQMGLEAARANLPDLMLLDFNMPIMNGYEVALALRNRLDTAQIPLVLITSEDTDHPLIGRLRHFCQEILFKPFRLRDIERVLDRMIARFALTAPHAAVAMPLLEAA